MKASLHKATVVLVAAAQVLVITHSAFAVHELSPSGALHHRAAERGARAGHAKHESPKATWCAEHTELKPVDDLACTAAQFGSMASTLAAPSPLVTAGPVPGNAPSRKAPQHRVLAALITAPKASPPYRS